MSGPLGSSQWMYASGGDYEIPYSCRFNDDDSAKLTWTPSVNGNQNTWTVSFWWKRGNIGSNLGGHMLAAGNTYVGMWGDNQMVWNFRGGGLNYFATPKRFFRDPSAWYHVVGVYDSTDGTAADRFKLWINGSQVTEWDTTTNTPLYTTLPSPTSASISHSTVEHQIGNGGFGYLDGYLAEFHFLDGIVGTPADFGETGDYGEWKPIEVDVTYGDQGYYLNFSGGATDTTTGITATRYGDFSEYVHSDGASATIDNDHATVCWFGAESGTGGIKYDYGSGNTGTITYVKLSIGQTTNFTNISILGSNDDTSYDTLNSDDSPLQVGGNPKSGVFNIVYSFTNTTAYRYYKVQFTTTSSTYHKLFELEFLETADAGIDSSGNGNNWTVTNLTAYDRMIDTPTNNFCTMNPLSMCTNYSLSEGSLKYTQTGSLSKAFATMPFPSSGKWYVEIDVLKSAAANHGNFFGIMNFAIQAAGHAGGLCRESGMYGIVDDDSTYAGATLMAPAGNVSSFGPAILDGNILQIAWDADNRKLYLGKDDTYYAYDKGTDGNPTSGTNETLSITDIYQYVFCVGHISSDNGAALMTINCGQDSSFAGDKTSGSAAASDANGYGDFYYTPPTNFLALCTANFPDVTAGLWDSGVNKHFNTILYDDGAGAKTGVGFQPDFVWIKARGDESNYATTAYEHELTDAVRGVTKAISSDSNNAETTDSTGLTAFGADGFTVGADTNYTHATIGVVAWCWKANGAGSANTDGDMAETVTVSANVDAGFSIVKYTGDGAIATVGHGLSAAPELIMIKNLDAADSWRCYHKWLRGVSETPGTGAEEEYIELDTTAYPADDAGVWNDTAPTSSVFTIGADAEVNTDNENYIAYCWHSVDGYSKVGFYSSHNNTFVYTGFRPAFIMIKKSYDGVGEWYMLDTKRDEYGNVLGRYVSASELQVEWDARGGSAIKIDALSNGFVLRAGTSHLNTWTGTYSYIAFAETPFKYANAR